MNKLLRKNSIRIMSILMTGCMFSGVLLQYKEENTPVVSGNTLISKVDAKI